MLFMQVPFNDPGEKQKREEARRAPKLESYRVGAQGTRKNGKRDQCGLALGRLSSLDFDKTKIVS